MLCEITIQKNKHNDNRIVIIRDNFNIDEWEIICSEMRPIRQVDY